MTSDSKICILGDSFVGKSAIVEQFVTHCYDDAPSYTLCDEYSIPIHLNHIERVLTVLDVTGLETYWSDTYHWESFRLTGDLSNCIVGFMLVFDTTNVESFSNIEIWLNDRVRKLHLDAPVLLVGAKCDDSFKRVVDNEDAEKLANKLGVKYIETSAKCYININEAFKLLLEQMYEGASVTMLSSTNIEIIVSNAEEIKQQKKEESQRRSFEQKQQKIMLQKQIKEQKKQARIQLNEKENTVKLLQYKLDKAKRKKRTIQVRFLKIVLTGSGAAGKTSFSNLLMRKKFVAEHHSTNVAHASHAVSVNKAVMQTSSVKDEVMWIPLDFDLQINYLRSVLFSSLKPVPKINENKLEAPSTYTSTYIQCDETKTEAQLAASRRSFSSTNLMKRWFTKLTVNDSIKGKHLLVFDNMLESRLKDENSGNSSDSEVLVYQPNEVLDVITLLDTGGQPEYIHLLPTINIYHTVNFIVHDLSKKLEEQVLVKYSQHNKQTFRPYPLPYSNIDMIKLLMSAVNDTVEHPSHNPKLVSIPGTDKNSYLCLVGTHADKAKDSITATASQLTTMVGSMEKCKAKVWQNTDGCVLFAVDNTTAGKANEDPMANIIRGKIEKLIKEKDIYDVPITWMMFELEIHKFCSNENRFYASFQECLALAKSSGLIQKEENVKSALKYYHLLGILLYYEEVQGLCNYIITDHQWFFDRLSNIVCLTFQDGTNDHHAAERFKNQGLLSKELFQHVNWNDEIKKEYFLSLLIHLKIVAPVHITEDDKEEYFLPFILPPYASQQKYDHLCNYGCIQGEPLLIRFHSGLLPRGVFCCLVVELLQNTPPGWHPHISQGHTFRDLLALSLPNAYSLCLFDHISYLEVQIRHKKENFHSVHHKVFDRIVNALDKVCDQLTFDHKRVQYGFLCKLCSKSSEDHIAVIPILSSPLHFAECSLNSTHHVELTTLHLVWFDQTLSSSCKLLLNCYLWIYLYNYVSKCDWICRNESFITSD